MTTLPPSATDLALWNDYYYLWASLPMVISAGDGFVRVVRERGIGMVVDEGDVDGWIVALETMAGDSARRDTMRRTLAAARGVAGKLRRYLGKLAE